MRKLFVDANVLIAGADSRSGASRAVLHQALRERIVEPDAREDRLRYLLSYHGRR